jgi:hypothetical protein
VNKKILRYNITMDLQEGGRRRRSTRGRRHSRQNRHKKLSDTKLRSRERSYRRRRKSSHCHGKSIKACRGSAGCYVVSGKKRKFCRKYVSRRRSRKA